MTTVDVVRCERCGKVLDLTGAGRLVPCSCAMTTTRVRFTPRAEPRDLPEWAQR